jgi:hypothetical protein
MRSPAPGHRLPVRAAIVAAVGTALAVTALLIAEDGVAMAGNWATAASTTEAVPGGGAAAGCQGPSVIPDQASGGAASFTRAGGPASIRAMVHPLAAASDYAWVPAVLATIATGLATTILIRSRRR